MSMSNTLKKILQIILIPSLTTVALFPVLIKSLGPHILSRSEVYNTSRMLFFATAAIGQIVYSVVSSTNYGIIFLPCIDGLFIFQSIAKKFYEHISLKAALGNHLIFMAISNLLSSTAAFIIALTNKGDLVYKIPVVVDYAVGIFSGIQFFAFPLTIYDSTDKQTSIINIIISTTISIVGLVVFKMYSHPIVLVGYMAIIGLISNILYQYTSLKFIHVMFKTENVDKMSFNTMFIDKLQGFKFQPELIYNNLHLLFSLTFLNICMFSLSIVLYLKALKIKLNLNREFLAFGLANLVCLFAPGTINFACSILFTMCGSTNRYSSLSTGITYLSMYLVYHLISNLIPDYLSYFILQFIGLSYLVSYLSLFSRLKYFDMFIVAMFVAVNFVNGGVLITFVLPILATFAIRICVRKGWFFTNKTVLDTEDKNTKLQGYNVSVPVILDAFNVKDFIDQIDKIYTMKIQTIDLDFTKCVFIDMSGNVELSNYLDGNEIPYRIIGDATNLYKLKRCNK